MRTIRTSIDIDATPSEAWEVLTDFDAYTEWNPFMSEVAGDAAVSARLSVVLAPPGGRRMAIRPTVTAVEPGKLLEWLGRLGLPGVFDGRHRFELEALEDGRTRLTHRETFTGLLVPLLWGSLVGPTTAGFEQFNAAFAARAKAASKRIDRSAAIDAGSRARVPVRSAAAPSR